MISIVMATYNGALFIEEQLVSLLQQTYSDIEIIIVDDCSDDDTINIIKRTFANFSFSNYRLILNESNIGPTLSFEKSFLMTNGQYIAFCDQDDIWGKDKLASYLNAANSTDADIVYSPSLLLKNSGLTRSVFPLPQTYKTLFGLLLHNNARGATVMARRSFLEKLVPFSDLYDKWIYFISCLYGKLVFIPTPFQFYRIHDTNYNAGKFRLRSKKDLLIKLNSSILFYHNVLLFVQTNRNQNSTYSHSHIFDTIKDIIVFHEEIISSLNSNNPWSCFMKYIKNVAGKEFSATEKLIYFYYFLIKFY